MRIAHIVLVSAVLLGSPLAASAQDRPVHFNIGGGPTFTLGDTGERFNTGWGPSIGVTFDVSPRFAAQFEYGYRWFNIPDEADARLGLLDANHQMHKLDFNLIANLTPPDSAVRAYIVAGPGMAHREVEITRYAGTGVVCDPWYYICGTYPIEAVLGSRGGWDFTFNVGAGVGFGLGDEGEFYIETKYLYAWGPEITPVGSSTAAPSKANGQYMPLTFGFRF